METVTLAERGLVGIAEGLDGRGPLVLCLHGFPDIPETFGPLMTALASRGYRVVAPYLRGYHPSTLEGAVDIDALTADVLAWADHLSPDRPVHLVGHDWGAVITHFTLLSHAPRFAASVAMSVPHPLTFLTNAAASRAQLRKSWYIGFFQAGKLADRVVTRRHGAFIETLWRAWSPGFEPPRDHLMKVRNCIVRSAPRPLDFYREAARSLAKSRRLYAELADPANRSSVPLLYLHGGGDGCIGPEIARGQERHFTGILEQEVLPGAGHFLHLEQPELVSRRVVDFLERQSEQSSAA